MKVERFLLIRKIDTKEPYGLVHYLPRPNHDHLLGNDFVADFISEAEFTTLEALGCVPTIDFLEVFCTIDLSW